MNKNTYIGGLVILILVIIGFYFFNREPQVKSEINLDNYNYSQQNNAQENTQNAGSGPQGSVNTNTVAVNNLANTNNQNSKMENTNIDNKNAKVTLKTSKGNIEIQMLGDSAPNTVANFLKLASKGFYKDVKFHRVIKGFMIQTGDPQSKDESLKDVWGTGGPGYKFADELTGKETYKRGTVAMANSGKNTNGSQFFIVTAEDSKLPPMYTVFGKVVSGIENALAIENVATDDRDRPLQNVSISDVDIK